MKTNSYHKKYLKYKSKRNLLGGELLNDGNKQYQCCICTIDDFTIDEGYLCTEENHFICKEDFIRSFGNSMIINDLICNIYTGIFPCICTINHNRSKGKFYDCPGQIEIPEQQLEDIINQLKETMNMPLPPGTEPEPIIWPPTDLSFCEGLGHVLNYAVSCPYCRTILTELEDGCLAINCPRCHRCQTDNTKKGFCSICFSQHPELPSNIDPRDMIDKGHHDVRICTGLMTHEEREHFMIGDEYNTPLYFFRNREHEHDDDDDDDIGMNISQLWNKLTSRIRIREAFKYVRDAILNKRASKDEVLRCFRDNGYSNPRNSDGYQGSLNNLYDMIDKDPHQLFDINNKQPFTFEKYENIVKTFDFIENIDVSIVDDESLISWVKFDDLNSDFFKIMCLRIHTIPDSFWIKLADRYDVLETWKKKNNHEIIVWLNALQYIKNIIFWDHLAQKSFVDDILMFWNSFLVDRYTIWHHIFDHNSSSLPMLLKSKIFMEQLAQKTHILKSWNQQNFSGENVWSRIVGTTSLSVFWDKLAYNPDLDDFIKSWITRDKFGITVWHYATSVLESDLFWEKISRKDEILKEWYQLDHNNTTIWCVAIKNIKSKSFWNNISQKSNLIELIGNWGDHLDKNNDIWFNAFIYLNLEEFWNRIVKEDRILNSWNYPIVHPIWTKASLYLKSPMFWVQFAQNPNFDDLTKDWFKLNNSGKTIWHIIVKRLVHPGYGLLGEKTDDFWNQIIKKDHILRNWDILGREGNTVWHHACNSIKSNSFWTQLSQKSYFDEILESWNIQNTHGDTVWHLALIYSDEFWEKIIRKDHILKTWDIKNKINKIIWHNAVVCIHSIEFWKILMQKEYFDDIIESWGEMIDDEGNTVWHNLFKIYSVIDGVIEKKTDEFWEYILQKDEIVRTWDYQNKDGNSVWYYVMLANISEEFWRIVRSKGYDFNPHT